MRDDPKGPLFRTIGRGTGQLTRTPLPQPNAYAMIRRRARAAGIATKIGNHTFRATGITAYLKNGGTLEKAASMANHASTRTTQLYDRRRERSASMRWSGSGCENPISARCLRRQNRSHPCDAGLAAHWSALRRSGPPDRHRRTLLPNGLALRRRCYRAACALQRHRGPAFCLCARHASARAPAVPGLVCMT